MTIFINQYFFMEVTKSLTRESEEDDEQPLAEFSSASPFAGKFNVRLYGRILTLVVRTDLTAFRLYMYSIMASHTDRLSSCNKS